MTWKGKEEGGKGMGERGENLFKVACIKRQQIYNSGMLKGCGEFWIFLYPIATAKRNC